MGHESPHRALFAAGGADVPEKKVMGIHGIGVAAAEGMLGHASDGVGSG